MTRETLLATLPAVATPNAYVGFNAGGTAFQAYNNYQLNGGAVAGGTETSPYSVLYAATITINCALSNVFEVGTLTGNTAITLTGGAAGQTVLVWLVQDATGGRTASVAPAKWPNGAAQALSTGANAVDCLIATYRANGFWYCTIAKGYA